MRNDLLLLAPVLYLSAFSHDSILNVFHGGGNALL
jgi:hypothetical protein